MWKDLKNSNKSTTYGLDSTIWPLKFGALEPNWMSSHNRARLTYALRLEMVRQLTDQRLSVSETAYGARVAQALPQCRGGLAR